jgi:hypothetical protein
MKNNYKPFSLVINLIGSQKNITIASNEIRNYLFDSYLGYKVIENKDIDNHFNRKCIAQDVIINKCDFLSNQQLRKLHFSIENTYNAKKLLACALLVRSKETDNYIQSLIHSPLINNIYNIDYDLNKKKNILFEIIYTNYYKN